MTIEFYLLTGCMLGFEYVQSEDTFVIDLFIFRFLIYRDE